MWDCLKETEKVEASQGRLKSQLNTKQVNLPGREAEETWTQLSGPVNYQQLSEAFQFSQEQAFPGLLAVHGYCLGAESTSSGEMQREYSEKSHSGCW